LTYSEAAIDKTAQERGGGQKDQGSAFLKLIPHAQQLLAVFYFLLQRFVEKIIWARETLHLFSSSKMLC